MGCPGVTDTTRTFTKQLLSSRKMTNTINTLETTTDHKETIIRNISNNSFTPISKMSKILLTTIVGKEWKKTSTILQKSTLPISRSLNFRKSNRTTAITKVIYKLMDTINSLTHASGRAPIWHLPKRGRSITGEDQTIYLPSNYLS